MRPAIETMPPASDYQVVVTTYDGAGMWRDRLIDQRDIIEVALGPDTRDLRCFSPTFWSGIPHPARIERVEVTVKGVQHRLSWPPPEGVPSPFPALGLRILLRHATDETPSTVEWSGNVTR